MNSFSTAPTLSTGKLNQFDLELAFVLAVLKIDGARVYWPRTFSYEAFFNARGAERAERRPLTLLGLQSKRVRQGAQGYRLWPHRRTTAAAAAAASCMLPGRQQQHIILQSSNLEGLLKVICPKGQNCGFRISETRASARLHNFGIKQHSNLLPVYARALCAC